MSVQAQGLPDQDRYREDNVFLSLTFPDGSVGTVAYFAGGDQAYSKERVEVFGDGRVAILDNFRRLEMSQEGRRRVRRAWLRQDKGFRGEWETFVKSVAQGKPPPIPYDHLFAVTQASFAAVESLRSRNTVAIKPLPSI
jgi:predicted dehydrogenase